MYISSVTNVGNIIVINVINVSNVSKTATRVMVWLDLLLLNVLYSVCSEWSDVENHQLPHKDLLLLLASLLWIAHISRPFFTVQTFRNGRRVKLLLFTSFLWGVTVDVSFCRFGQRVPGQSVSCHPHVSPPSSSAFIISNFIIIWQLIWTRSW